MHRVLIIVHGGRKRRNFGTKELNCRENFHQNGDENYTEYLQRTVRRLRRLGGTMARKLLFN